MNWFREDNPRCAGSPASPYDRSIENWADHRLTLGDSSIMAYLLAAGVTGKTIMHVGIGGGDFERGVAPHCGCMNSITMNPDEINDLPGNVFAIVADKGLPYTYAALAMKFDYIIDAELTPYACCVGHFLDMMDLMLSSLAPGGAIITHAESLSVRWAIKRETGKPCLPTMGPRDLDDYAEANGISLEWTESGVGIIRGKP